MTPTIEPADHAPIPGTLELSLGGGVEGGYVFYSRPGPHLMLSYSLGAAVRLGSIRLGAEIGGYYPDAFARFGWAGRVLAVDVLGGYHVALGAGGGLGLELTQANPASTYAWGGRFRSLVLFESDADWPAVVVVAELVLTNRVSL